jgi:anthranilate phosphoribosyltransferase
VLAGKHGAARDIVLLNAGAAVYVSGLAATLEDGVAKARAVIDAGAARRKLDELVEFTNVMRA